MGALSQEMDRLYSRMSGIDQSLDHRILSLTTQIEDSLRQQSSLTADYLLRPFGFSPQEDRFMVEAQAVPREYTEGLQAVFTFTSPDFPVVSVPGDELPGHCYRTEVSLPLSNEIKCAVSFVRPDGSSQNQLLETLQDLRSRYRLELHAFHSGEIFVLNQSVLFDCTVTLDLTPCYLNDALYNYPVRAEVLIQREDIVLERVAADLTGDYPDASGLSEGHGSSSGFREVIDGATMIGNTIYQLPISYDASCQPGESITLWAEVEDRFGQTERQLIVGFTAQADGSMEPFKPDTD